MFPYPSGSKLHAGHYYNYSIVDSYCNMERYFGIKVFQPFGFDGHGLPAENAARLIGSDPETVTKGNISAFIEQMKQMNTKYDILLSTTDASYVKWTQWLFTQLYERGLAYKKLGIVNWCDSCETVLANEQCKDGKCDRCGSSTVSKELDQWYFRITDYKDRLIKNLDWIDYPKSTIEQQRNWLANQQDWCVSRQRKWGCPIPIEGETDTLDTFVDSSFYYVRFCDPGNPNELCSKEKYKQVDLYIGGSEHACMHLIYARFINMFLYDIGVVAEEEPFKKLVHQGMIKYKGEKMSKSRGNTVNLDGYNPDEIRLYLMFLGHYFDGGEWNDKHIAGIKRFMYKFKTWTDKIGTDEIDMEKFKTTIFAYTKSFKFNKVVSEFMILVNNNKHLSLTEEQGKQLIELFRIYAPGFK